jgi:hypothetical protein
VRVYLRTASDGVSPERDQRILLNSDYIILFLLTVIPDFHWRLVLAISFFVFLGLREQGCFESFKKPLVSCFENSCDICLDCCRNCVNIFKKVADRCIDGNNSNTNRNQNYQKGRNRINDHIEDSDND